VFVSYSRADDAPPPHDEKPVGWVKFFWDQVRWGLNDGGARRAKLWLDRYDIEPAEAFTDKIGAAMKGAAVIVPFLPENWSQPEIRLLDYHLAAWSRAWSHCVLKRP
jgi:hypothetical protein